MKNTSIFKQLLQVRSDEWAGLAWSFGYFFCVLSGYYILRPLREEMGVAAGVDKLQWLFSGVFVIMLLIVPLYGWISSRFPRRKFVPWIYVFFILNIVGFYLAFHTSQHPVWVGRIFFVWVSVFNLFVVAVFWSFMADLYTTTQAKRLFGIIAAGGSCGAISGPTITALLAPVVGVYSLLLISAGLLSGAVLSIHRLLNWHRCMDNGAVTAIEVPERAPAMGGSIWAGAKLTFTSTYFLLLALFTVLGTMTGSFLYFHQADIVSRMFDDPVQRTRLFASVDLGVNTLTVLVQVFFTSRIVNRLGIAFTLLILPIIAFIGLLAIVFSPVLGVLIVVQVLRRATAFSLTVPTANMLYTVVTPEAKYKVKHFIDTVVYRFGDVLSGWTFTLLKSSSWSLAAIAAAGAVVALLWISIAVALGRSFQQQSRSGSGRNRDSASAT